MAAKKIKKDVSERYLRLPVDADGVPIKIGDKIKGVYSTFTVCAVSDRYVYWNDGKHYDAANLCHHVKERTLEDILFDFGNTIADSASYPNWEDVRKVAKEIRESMKTRN